VVGGRISVIWSGDAPWAERVGWQRNHRPHASGRRGPLRDERALNREDRPVLRHNALLGRVEIERGLLEAGLGQILID
jgi:hypothetical protein